MTSDDRLRVHLDRVANSLQTAVPTLDYIRKTSESNLRDLFAVLDALREATANLDALRREKGGA